MTAKGQIGQRQERPELPRVTGQVLARADLRDAPINEHHDRAGLADRITAVW